MGYTKYCKGYSDYTIVNKLTNHLEHKPGDAVEVDWSGPVMEYVDTATGEAVKVYLFVAPLPYSQYSYVPTQKILLEFCWTSGIFVVPKIRILLNNFSPNFELSIF